MNIQKKNAVVDILAFIAGVISLVTGIVLFFKFPNGEKTGRLVYWGLTKFEWGNWHAYSSFILVGLVLAHLLLHWSWIKNLKSILFDK